MEPTVANLSFLAPGLADVSDEDKQKALDYAVAFRPSCLDKAQQDLAQLYYAIWFLFDRQAQTAGGDAGVTIIAGVKSIKEGDVQITYGNADGTVVADPYGFYGRWKALNDLCGYGAIVASPYRGRNGCPC